jgi:hypothetical protein
MFVSLDAFIDLARTFMTYRQMFRHLRVGMCESPEGL